MQKVKPRWKQYLRNNRSLVDRRLVGLEYIGGLLPFDNGMPQSIDKKQTPPKTDQEAIAAQ